MEFVHGSMTTVPNGDELMADIVARIRPFVQPETDMDHTVSNMNIYALRLAAQLCPKSDEVSTAVANHDIEGQRRAELGALLSKTCNDLRFRDPFFSILGPASYAGIARLRVQPAKRYADELVNAIDDMIAALRDLEPIPATLQKCVSRLTP